MHPREPGTYACYIAGCRLPECVAAERLYQTRRARQIAYGRPLKVDSTGGVRRIQALMAIGWSGTHLAERLGCLRSNLPVHVRFPTMRTGRSRAIAALYDELRRTAGPSQHTASRAEAAGFLPPECWSEVDIDDPTAVPHPLWVAPVGPDVDEVAIDLVAAGHRVRLTHCERDELARRLMKAGLGVGSISARLHMNGSEVRKLLARLEVA